MTDPRLGGRIRETCDCVGELRGLAQMRTGSYWSPSCSDVVNFMEKVCGHLIESDEWEARGVIKCLNGYSAVAPIA